MAIISLGRAFTAVADADPDRAAVSCGGVTTTRGELESLSNRTARALADLGVSEGSYVTIGLPNSTELYSAVLAAWKLGAVPQPVSPRLPDRERAAIVELADPAVVLGADPDAHPGRHCLPVGWQPDASLDDTVLPDRTAPAWKAPTSGGSTGRPKLIVAGDPGVIDTDADPGMGVQRNGVMMVPGPMYHNAPFSYSTRGLVVGNHVVTMPRFDAEATLAGIEQHRADWMLLVPTMMLRIWRLEGREQYDLSSLRVLWHMAAPCPPWLKEAWIGWLGGERVFELYAGTEAQAVTVIRGDEWMGRRGSVGKPLYGEMKVLGPDGEEVPPGTIGEIYMRAPGGKVTYRYLGADAKRTGDGWESLGDLGSIDADGYVYLTDRLGDMILSGGANIYPAEVEAAIDEHPAVRSCAVLGLPDEELGNTVHAIVQLAAGEHAVSEDDLRAHLAERLVRYKIPRTFEFTEEPLRDDAGKLRRSALRDERIKGAGS
jgi:bile acid-coenzyme A ligase